MCRAAALALSAVALAACSQPTPTLVGRTYTDRESGFSIEIPEGWGQAKRSAGQATTVTFRPERGQGTEAAIGVTVIRLPAGTTLDEVYARYRATIIVDEGTVTPGMTNEQFAREYQRMLRSAASVVTRAGRELDTGTSSIDGVLARWLAFTHVPPGRTTTTLRGTLHVAVRAECGYAVWCEATEATFARIRPDCKRSVTSVKLLAR